MSEGAGVQSSSRNWTMPADGGFPVLGELRGYGASADAYRITDTHPGGLGAVLAMRGALEDASLGPEAIDYVNAHGTSTAQNDVTETRAIEGGIREEGPKRFPSVRISPCSAMPSLRQGPST